MNLQATDAAYIAGILDGEGCFMLGRHKSDQNPMGFAFRTRVELVMCELNVIQHIANLTGRNISSKRLRSGRIAHKVQWTNANAVALVRKVIPFLVGKRAQAELILQFEETVTPGRGRAYKAEDLPACEAIYFKLRELKSPNALRC